MPTSPRLTSRPGTNTPSRFGTVATLVTLTLVAGAVIGTGASTAQAGDSAGAVAGGRRGAAASLSAGAEHTCALLNDNTISCWGSDAKGQIGNGAEQAGPYQTPQNTLLPSGRTAKAIAAGGVNACVVLDDNRLTCWGDDDAGQIGDGGAGSNLDNPNTIVSTPETVVAVGVNLDYSCGLFASGNVRCWGSDDDGQLGNGGPDVAPNGGDVDTVGNGPILEFPGGRSASAITTGKTHACALLDNGQISCWGLNADGEIGDGSAVGVVTAPSAQLALPPGRTAEGVSAGGNHTCAVLENGDVSCWGSDAQGQLGNGAPSADVDRPSSAIALPRRAVAVATGLAHTCAVLDDNTLYCWGDDSQGQVGTPGANANAVSPVLISLPPVRAVALGDLHTCALLTDGTVTCWGSDAQGQLGNGATGSLSAPSGTSIPGLTIAENAGTPSAPWQMSATGGRELAQLSWERPLDDGGKPITGYRIQESVDNGTTWTTRVENTGSTQLSFDLTTATPSLTSRFRVAAINSVGASPYSQPSSAVVINALTDIKAITPIRLLDTRSNGATVDGEFQATGPNPEGNELRVRVAGRGGATGVPSNAPAAVLNLTGINADKGGFATLYPCGARPNASTLNFPAQRNVANAAIAKLDAAGYVCVYTNVTTQLVIDATGYVPIGSQVATVEPARVFDSRPTGETIDGLRLREGVVAAGSSVEVQITGRVGTNVPAGADTALLNLTAVNPTQSGFATVYPCGTRPQSSSLNFDQNVNKANAVVAKLTAAGSVCIFVERTTNLIVDVTGYATSSTLASVTPVRLLDTRPTGATIDNLFAAGGFVDGGTVVKVRVAGREGVPSGARLAALSVVAVNPQAKGFLTVFPCGSLPNASTLNFEARQNVPNLAITSLDGAGDVCIFASVASHVLVDVTAAQ